MKKKNICVLICVSLLFCLWGCSAETPESTEAYVPTETYDDTNPGEIFFRETEDEHISAVNEMVYYANNELLLVAAESATYEDIQELAESFHAEIVGWIEQTGDYQLLLAEEYTQAELEDIVSEIGSDSNVEYAYLNFVFPAESTTVDSRDGFIYGEEWEKDLQNFINCEGKSWGLEAIDALAAWDILAAYEEYVEPVRIGLIDNGFDVDHEDLGFAEVFYATEADHGTHVAGIMAARADNEEGICGVYPYGNGNLYGVSCDGMLQYSENGSLFTSSMALKIAYSELILRDVKVINTSLGFNYYTWDSPLAYLSERWYEQVEFLESNSYILGDFLNRLLEKGYDFVLVTSAGNDSQRDDGVIYDSKYNFWTTVIDYEQYPEVYDRIIVVGAVDSSFEPCYFSNGGDRVDIYAPGDDIFSTLSNDKYDTKSGTSMATPHVSGVAAMVWSLNNDLTGAQVKEIVCRHSNLRATSCKMVDAYIALEAAWRTSGNADIQLEEYGGILCWVVDASDTGIAIEDATVTATNLETGTSESAQTDAFGHFEIFLPEGSYTLSVQAEGYNDYIWRDDSQTTIEVHAGGVNYLEDWIKLQAATEPNGTPKLLTQVNGYDDSGDLVDEHHIYYDDAGRVIRIEMHTYHTDVDYTSEEVTTFTYDSRGRLLSEVTFPIFDGVEYNEPAFAISVEYTYNEAGQLIKRRGSEGGAVEESYEYDPQGRIIRSVQTYDTGRTTLVYSYNDNGLVVRAMGEQEYYDWETSEIEITYIYDKYDRLIQETRITESDTTRYEYDYEYDYTFVNLILCSEEYDIGAYEEYDTRAYFYDPHGTQFSLYQIYFWNAQFYADTYGYLAKIVNTSKVYEFYYDGEVAVPLENPSEIMFNYE